MSILVDAETRVICQGITGIQATFYVERAIASGTKMVGGVRPGKGGRQHLDLPVFDTVQQAKDATGADTTVVFVPKAVAAAAIMEAIEADMALIVCITEHIPVLDMVDVLQALEKSNSKLIGPNSPGIITPGACRIGIMPIEIFRPGSVGIVTRSSTLTYEAVLQTSVAGLGQSTCIGIGGDTVRGMGFIECLEQFKTDPDTKAVLLIGEIGGSEEESTAEYLRRSSYPKPVVAYIAGQSAMPERRMGHASAIIEGGTGAAAGKIEALQNAGVQVVQFPLEIGSTVASLVPE